MLEPLKAQIIDAFSVDERHAEDHEREFNRSRNQRTYNARLIEHPDCRDPEHPGCNTCCGNGDC